MPQVLIAMEVTPEEHEAFRDRGALVVPLSWPAEAHELKACINGVDDFVRLVAKSLSTLAQVIETKGCDVAEIEKTLAMMMQPARDAVDLNDRCRELLGRAAFVDAVEPKKGWKQ